MSVQVKGSGTIGGIDEGLNVVGVVTSTSFVGTGVSVVGVVTATSFVGSGANLTSLPAQATVNNNADNRVITGGSGVNLYAESGFTYDGTIVQIPDRINLNTAGTYIKSNQIAFNPTGTAYLDHYRTGQDIQIRMSTSSSLDTTGPTFKSNGNLAFASGKGIDFSATANVGGTSSELLDDYEEGSYTPEFSSGFSAISYHNPRVGYYTRVGNLCHFSIYIYVYQATGDGNQVRITLPFTSASGSARESGCYTVYSNGLMSNTSNEISHCTYLIGQNYSYIRPCKVINGAVINGNNTRLGAGANNQYLILAGQMFV